MIISRTDKTWITGNIVFDALSNDGDLSLPFSFLAVSNAVGSLNINVTDELTYFAENAPKLSQATVILRDYFTGLSNITLRVKKFAEKSPMKRE